MNNKIKLGAILAICLCGFFALAAFTGVGIWLTTNKGRAFAADGYAVSETDTLTENIAEAPEQVYFAAGTGYRTQYPSSVSFKDIQGNKKEIGLNSYLHYADGSISALSQGVLVNMDDVGNGLVSHYGTSSSTILAAAGSGYTVESNGEGLSFSDIIWKLSNDKALFSSASGMLSLPDGTRETISGWLEAEYPEDGIVRLTTESRQWLVVADGSSYTFADGVTFDFASRIIRNAQGEETLTLQEMLLDADDNIAVKSAEDWVAPEFNFDVLDGENGEDGVSGENGAAGSQGKDGEAGTAGVDGEQGEEGSEGEDGEEGEEGSDGSDGAAGSAGASGNDGASGASGANGAAGKSRGDGTSGTITQQDTRAQASFSIESFENTAGSMEMTFSVTDVDGVLLDHAGEGAVYIYDSNNYKLSDFTIIDDESGTEETDHTKLTFNDGQSFTVSCQSLNPDEEYRIVVSSGYTLVSGSGTKDYINRTFYTDSVGIDLEKEYAEEDAFILTLSRKDYYDAELGSQDITVSVEDQDGNVLLSRTVTDSELKDAGNELELDTSEFEGEGDNLDGTLQSDTSYRVSYTLGSGENARKVTYTWKTLKKAPELEAGYAYVVSSDSFELSVQVKSNDDNASLTYRYEIYDPQSDGYGYDTPVYTITTTKSNNVPLYIGTTTADGGSISRARDYFLTVTATYNDNEKECETPATERCQFYMDDRGQAIVSWAYKDESAGARPSSIDGILSLNLNGIEIGVNQSFPLILMVESSGTYRRTLTYTSLNGDGSSAPQLQGDTLNIPVSLSALKTDTTYRLSVWASTLSASDDGGYTYTNAELIGEYALTTGTYEALTASIVNTADDNTTSALAATVYIGDGQTFEAATEDEDMAYTLKAVRAVKAKLYLGSQANADGSNQRGDECVVWEDRESGNDSPWAGKLSEVWDDEEGIELTEASFNLTSASLQGSAYTIVLSAAYDYTWNYDYDSESTTGENISEYKNEIAIAAATGGRTAITITKGNNPPALPDPQDEAVTATPIYNKNLPGYGLDKDKNLDDMAIVGYQLESNYDNSSALAQSVTYYVLTQGDINDFDADASNANRPNDVLDEKYWGGARTGEAGSRPKLKFTIPVTGSSTRLPTLTILFMDPPATGTQNVSEAYANSVLTPDELADNQDSDSYGVMPKMMSASTQSPVVFSGSGATVGRGWHYVFAYKARLKRGENSNYIYPDDLGSSYIAGQTFLSSHVMDTPKQQAETELYLYKMEGASQNNRIIWKYRLEDCDGTLKGDLSDRTNLFYAAHTGATSNIVEPTAPEGTDGDSMDSVGLIPTASTGYQLSLLEWLYMGRDEDEDGKKTGETASQVELLIHQGYTKPFAKGAGSPYTISMAEPESGDNLVKFYITPAAGNISLDNIERVVINASRVDGSGGSSYAGSQTVYYQHEDAYGKSYYGYDLSKAASAGDTLTFRVTVYYDDGAGGIYYMDPDNAEGADYALQSTNTGNYLRWYFTQSVSGEVSNNYTMSSSAAISAYTFAAVPESDRDSRYDADQVWQAINRHSVGANQKNIVYLDYTSSGAEELAHGGYPVPKRLSSVSVSADGNGTAFTLEVGELSPSLNDSWFSAGITNVTGSFTTNSADQVAEQTHEVTDDDGNVYLATGKFACVQVYRLAEDGSTKEGDAVSTVYVLLDGEGDTRYEYLVEGLEKSTTYQMEITCETEDGSTVYFKDSGRDQDAVYQVTTLGGLEVTQFTFQDISYLTYEDKSVSVTYQLSLITGYTLEYELQRYNSTTGDYETYQNHDGVMAAMGYTMDGYGNYVDSSGNAWQLASYMTETFLLEPGDNIFSPGGQYRLVIHATDLSGASVFDEEEPSAVFIWDSLVQPTFYLESTPDETGRSMSMKLSAGDPNRIIVGGTYVVTISDADGENEWVLDTGSVYDANGANQITSISKDELEPEKGYLIRVYGYTDSLNSGGMSAISAAAFEGLARAERDSLLLYQTTQQTIAEWGGRLGSFQVRKITAAGNVQLSLLNGYGLDKITKITVSAQNTTTYDSKTVSVTEFSFSDGETKSTTLTIPTGLRGDDGDVATITVFIYAGNTRIAETTVAIPYGD